LTPTIKTIKVKTKKLDNIIKSEKLINQISVIKIDTEGHEIEVLDGMKKIIKKNNRINFFIEFNPKCLLHAGKKPEDLLIFLEKNNFITYAIDEINKKINYINKNNWNNFVDYKKYINILAIKKERLKILFFSHTAGLWGSERSLLELIDELLEKDVLISIVLPYEGPLIDELKKRAVNYEIIGGHWWWCSSEKLSEEEIKKRINDSFINFLSKKQILDQWNPDLIFTNTLTIPWGAIYSQLTGKPHITFIREFGDLDFNFNFFYGYEASINFINTYSDFVFTNSKATLNHFKRFIDNKKLDFSYAYIEIKKNLLNEKVPKIFTDIHSLKLIIVGGLLPSKGQKDAILAINELVKKGYKKVQLVILGPYYDVNYLNQLDEFVKKNSLEKNVKFIDFVKNPYPYIKQADVFLMCSKNESYGRVTIEAMALKKPVIGTNTGGTKELIKDGFNGFLYSPQNYKELAKKIEFFYNNRDKIKEFGNHAYFFYKKTFSKKNYGEKIYKIMKKLIDEKNKKKENIFQSILNNLLNSFSSKLTEYQNQINQQNNLITNLQNEINLKNKEIENLNAQLAKIYSSKTWKMLYFYKKITSFLKKLVLRK
jgi:glycosyltransferase involved in cell wall biosynthesis